MSDKPTTKIRKMNGNNFHLAEFVRDVYFTYPEPGTTIEEMLEPSYWMPAAEKMKPGSRIEAIAEDNTFFAEFLVITSSRQWAKVEVLRWVELGGKSVPDEPTAAFFVKFRGPVHKWCVLRSADKELLHTGSLTQPDAQQWMIDHEKALAH